MVAKAEQRNLVQCTVVGDGMVGKTCLSKAFSSTAVPDTYVATVFENYAGTATVNGDDYLVSIFDSAGQHDYESLREFTYKDSEVFVLCYSVVDRESFDSIKEFWVPEIKHNMARKRPIILVATQADLRNTTDYDADMPVSKEEGDALAKEIGAARYVECSIGERSTVKELFSEVVQAALKCRKRRLSLVHRLLGI